MLSFSLRAGPSVAVSVTSFVVALIVVVGVWQWTRNRH